MYSFISLSKRLKERGSMQKVQNKGGTLKKDATLVLRSFVN